MVKERKPFAEPFAMLFTLVSCVCVFVKFSSRFHGKVACDVRDVRAKEERDANAGWNTCRFPIYLIKWKLQNNRLFATKSAAVLYSFHSFAFFVLPSTETSNNKALSSSRRVWPLFGELLCACHFAVFGGGQIQMLMHSLIHAFVSLASVAANTARNRTHCYDAFGCDTRTVCSMSSAYLWHYFCTHSGHFTFTLCQRDNLPNSLIGNFKNSPVLQPKRTNFRTSARIGGFCLFLPFAWLCCFRAMFIQEIFITEFVFTGNGKLLRLMSEKTKREKIVCETDNSSRRMLRHFLRLVSNTTRKI